MIRHRGYSRCLAACFLAGALPVRAASYRGAPPAVQPGREVVQDENNNQSPQKNTALALISALGDATNNTVFPDDNIKGDVERFRKRADNELVDHGSDKPLFDILKNTVEAEHTLGDGYNSLALYGLRPLAHASPMVEEVLQKLQQIVEQNNETIRDLKGASAAIERAVAPFTDDPPHGGDDTVDPSRLSRIKQVSADARDALKEIKEEIKQADQSVDEAQNGIESSKQDISKAQDKAQKAVELDKEALHHASENRARGMAGQSGEGHSGPVLAFAANMLKAASERTNEAKKKMNGLTDPDGGILTKIADAASKSADLNEQAAGKGQKGAATANQKGAELDNLAAQYANNPSQDLIDQARKAKDAATKAKDAAKQSAESAAQAADQLQQLLAKTQGEWESTQDNVLGRIRDESELNSKLPALPDPEIRAQAPPEPKQVKRGKQIKSGKIKYPEVLHMTTEAAANDAYGQGSNLDTNTESR